MKLESRYPNSIQDGSSLLIMLRMSLSTFRTLLPPHSSALPSPQGRHHLQPVFPNSVAFLHASLDKSNWVTYTCLCLSAASKPNCRRNSRLIDRAIDATHCTPSPATVVLRGSSDLMPVDQHVLHLLRPSSVFVMARQNIICTVLSPSHLNLPTFSCFACHLIIKQIRAPVTKRDATRPHILQFLALALQ